MNLDHAFITAIVRAGLPHVMRAKAAGIIPEDLDSQTACAALEFVYDYASKYKGVPDMAIVSEKVGLHPDLTPGSPDFFIDAILEKRLHRQVQRGMASSLELLDRHKPKDAYQTLETFVRDTRKSNLVHTPVQSMFALGPEVLEQYEQIKAGKRGILTRWPSLNDATMGFWPQDLVLFVARVATGKCVAADTEIVNAETGEIVTIEEVVKNPSIERIWSWSKIDGVHPRAISDKVDTGEKECIQIRFRSGRRVTVTMEHPLLTPDGWKQALFLAVGDSVALPSRVLPAERPVSLSLPQIEVLARRTTQGLVDAHGVPPEVFRLPLGQLAEFIGAFWMHEGCVEGTGPFLSLASEKVARQLQHLLLRLGILTLLRERREARYKPSAWRLRVYRNCWRLFKDLIPLRGRMKERIDVIARQEWPQTTGLPTVSEGFVRRIQNIIDLSGKSMEEVGKRFGYGPSFTFRGLFSKESGQRLNLENFRLFAKAYQCEPEFSWIYSSDIFWDGIEDIEPVGVKKIRDLTVAPTHCFIANDIIVHNTWSSIIVAHDAWAGQWSEFEGGKVVTRQSDAQKRRVLYVTTEISKLRIASRFYSVRYKLPYKDFQSGKLWPKQEAAFRAGIQELMDVGGLHIVGGDFDFTMSGLEAAIEQAEPELLVLDGAYLMLGEGRSRTEQAANTFENLKRLLHRYKISGVVTSQLNRQANPNQKNTVSTESIALTDVAGWTADLAVGMIQNEDLKEQRRMFYKMLKVREGEGKEIELLWDFSTMNFDELPPAVVLGGGPSGGGDADETGAAEDDVPF